MLKIRAEEKKKLRGANRGEKKWLSYKKRGTAHKVETQRKTVPCDKSCKGEGPTHSVFIQRRLCKKTGGPQQGLEGRVP